MPKLNRDGVNIYYEVHGSGPPLILTHGYSSTSAMWQGQIAALSRHYKLVLWDMRGHGQSDYPENPAAYSEALTKAGALVAGDRLQHTHTATTVRVEGGKTQVLNGPYAETREQLGGYYIVEAADLDAALSWAARCPGASHGAVEVRPIWSM